MSRVLRRLLTGLAALLLSAVLAWAWLWHSASGRAFVLAQASGALADGTLRWDSAAGTLAGGVQLRGVVFSSDGLHVQIAQAHAALAPSAIWRGVVRLHPLQLSGVQIQILSTAKNADAPFVWPTRWPVLPLPLTIEVPALAVRELHLQRGEQSPLPVLAIDGGFRIASDQVRITGLTILRADDTTRIDGRIDLAGNSKVALTLAGESSPAAKTAWQFQAGITGKPADLRVTLNGRVPGPLSLSARVRGDGDRLRWQLTTRAQDIAPAIFGGPAGRFGVALDVDGIDATATVSGQVQRDGQVLHLLPSQIAWQDEQIVLSPLLLSVLDGEVRIAGSVGFAGEAPVMALRIDGDALHWGAGADVVTATGSAQVAGTFAQWRLAGEAELHRQTTTAHMVLSANGDAHSAVLEQLLLSTDAGQSQISGELLFSPTLRWQMRGTITGFDPGFFAPEFPGTLSANLVSDGSTGDDGLQFTAALNALTGRVRGRALGGHAHLQHDAGRSSGALDLHVGSSHVIASGQHDASGKVPLSLRARFSPLNLNDLLPDARGSVSGELALSGNDRNAVLRGEMDGEHLSFGDFSVAALRLRAGPSGSAGTHLELSLDAFSGGGVRLAQVQAEALGTLAQARWSLHATANQLSAEASGNWLQTAALRQVQLQTLQLAPTQGDPWRLVDPVTLTLGDVLVVSPMCLAQALGRVCAQGNWPGDVKLSAHAFDLALLNPLLQRDDVQFGLDGHVSGDATLRSDADRVSQGMLQLRFSPGALQVLPRGEQPAFAWRALGLDATLADGAVMITLDGQAGAGGVVHGQLSTGLATESKLAGSLQLDIAQVAWLELFSPDIAAPSGHLHGQLTLAGSRQAPLLSGQLLLTDFTAQLPALGIALANSDAQLDGAADGTLHLEATLDSGDGPLLVVADGTLASADTFTARISGERVKLIDNADLRAFVNPDLDIVRDATGFSVSGRLVVPEAHIALDKMQASAAARSPDVVILDPITPEHRQRAIPVALNVQVSFGKAVELAGFGLDGKLRGDLSVTQAFGREPLGTGTLNVSGSYERYGKPLTIRHARLSYTRSPLDNPALDIRAERSIDAQMVGVQVSGSALQPITTLVSNPTLDNNETLSWLVLGRPLRSAQQGDGAKLNAAASALGAGGNLLAEQLGARLGLDEAAVGESRTLGDNTLSVGKFISPRLYISYGISLLGVGQVVALKYLLGGGFEVEIESGLESRGSINWQTER